MMRLEAGEAVTTTNLERGAGRNRTCSKTRHPGLFAARPVRERLALPDALHAPPPVVRGAKSPVAWKPPSLA